MATALEGHIHVGSLAELEQRGCRVVSGRGHTIAVFYHDGQVYALDNRCPHMGFPLERGSVKDGILTCHWHHARFDLAGGGTFDPFADDVRPYPAQVVDGQVWVSPVPVERDEVAHWKTRLQDSLEHDIRLVTAKAVIGLFSAGADYRDVLGIGAEFGTRYAANGWGAALSILTSTASILPYLHPEDRPRALYQGLFHVAQECAGKAPRFPLEPLPTSKRRPEVLKKWFRTFVDVRDAEGAERCLRTAIDAGAPPNAVADMVFAAATDRLYLDGGHSLDFDNKAFELLDHIGWEHAGQVLTSLVPGLCRARRSEELSAWRHPVDVAALVWAAREELPALVEQGSAARGWDEKDDLVPILLGDDPAASVSALKEAVALGAPPEALGATLAHAAFLRMARFHTSNEFGDWDTVHNTLTATNALHQALRRCPSAELLRGIFDAAMSIYLDRFLNTPAARLPGPNGSVADPDALQMTLLQRLDVQQQVEESAELVSRYIESGSDPDALLATLGHAVLREDADFHAFQLVEAGFRQYAERRGTEAGRHVLIAVARFFAAHSPTPRAVGQTYTIALRLHRGEELYREE